MRIYNSNILTQRKCGTRFFDKFFGNGYDVDYNDLINNNLLTNQKNIIIIRNPYEHFISALHTDVVVYEDSGNIVDTTTIDNILNDFIRGNGHWNINFFRNMEFFLNSKNNTLVDLKHVNNFFDIKFFNKQEYDLDSKIFTNKKNTFDVAKIYHKEKIDIIIKEIELEFYVYKKLKNIYVPNKHII